MRIILRTSKWAVWSRRFASFALPLSVLPVWFHRIQLLESGTFQILLGLALVLAVFAVLFAIAAYIRLWKTGDHGWGRATLGLFIGLAILSPFIYGAAIGSHYPLVNDISTNLAQPIELFVKDTSSLKPLSQQTIQEIQAAFPDAITRSYGLAPSKVFEIIQKLVLQHKWDVQVQRMPGAGGRQGQINAMAMTFMGWRDEVAIRVIQTNIGSQVDMRSTSLNGVGDLGKNGLRVEQFLNELDQLIAQESS